MRLSYGSYNHADNEVWFNISRPVTRTPRGRRERQRERWDIWGALTGDTESALTSAMAALEAAYSVNGQDLVFWGNNSQMTRHNLLTANTINGTFVERFDWLPGNRGIWGSGTEYAGKRSYHIVVSGDILWADDNLYFYRSTVSYTGTTGPKRIWLPSLTGVPQLQTVQAFTTQKAVQSGMNIGLTDWIPVDGPLFPAYEHFDRRNINRSSPLEVNINVSLKFPTRWTYYFESPVPLV